MPDRGQRAKPGDKRQIEFRRLESTCGPLGLRTDGSPGFDGYASTNWHLDSYLTAFAPGAWAKTISEQRDRVLVLWQHDPAAPIGRPTEMVEDGKGLRVSADVLPSAIPVDVMGLLRMGVPFGLSVGFRTIRERKATEADPIIIDANAIPEWMKQDGSNPLDFIWVIEEARLYEFSVVSFPANLHAEIETVRAEQSAQALSLALDDLRAGRLDAAGRALVAEIAAAWQSAAPDRGDPAPRTDEQARRDREFALSFWAGSVGIDPATLGVGRCAA
jgi:HK97 family phage prohead protease